MDYNAFLATKLSYAASVGLPVRTLPERLFPFQRQVTSWAIERGRAAIWLDTGLGKTCVQLVYAQHVAEQAGDVLILAPLAVSQQTVREGAMMGIPVTLCRTQADVRPGINITNYERLHHFDVTRMAGVVLDECFPHDTPIEVLSIDNTLELKHIADIRIGDVIVNASGVDHVTQIYKRSINRAVRLGIAGRGTIVCSENHPFFTMHGWQSAQDLRPGDYLMETAEAMRLVRRNISTEVCSPEDATLLRSILLSEMAHEYPGAQSQSAYAGGGEKAWPLAVAVAQEQRSKGHEGDSENYRSQSYAESRDTGESVCNIASDEAQTFRAWGQWDWFDGPATDFIGCTWRWLDGGMVFISGPTDSGLSRRLQARLSQSRAQDQCRSGWPIALQQEGCRSEAGRQTGFARVDSVEILEQGHPLLEQYRDAEGHIYFYDIKAARHPSFSVDGLLVHNSSILKAFDGKTRTQLIEAFRHTPYKLCCTATPSPNDYMELGNHCLPFHSVIITREGNKEIGDIVKDRESVEVLSFDGKKFVWRYVTGWQKHPNAERLWRIQWARGGRGAMLRSTPNHPILTRSGWIPASKVAQGDEVAIAASTWSPDQEEIIYGTLLGDSWLRVHKGWPALCSCHTKPQWAYLDWLADAVDTKAFDVATRPGGFIRGRQINGQPQRRLRTKQSPNLWPIYRLAYPDGKKRVTRSWLDRIGPLGLAVWAMDDGTTRCIRYTREVRSCECPRGQHKKLCAVRGPRETVKGYHFVFNTDGFTPDERAIIVTWLKERFNLNVVASGGKKIVLTRESTRRFRELVAPYMILGDHEKQWLFPIVSHESKEDIMWMSVASSCPDIKDERTWYVYDIEVEETHNFVMASGLVVHNSEFLGVMSRNEMLATYFTHDGGNTSQWRLKKHAEQLFWRWVASWAFALTHPMLIGDTTPGYDLPPLNRHLHPVAIDTAHTGMMLFPMEVSSLSEQRTAKRAGLEARVQEAIETIQREPDEPWLVWTELNDEADAIAKALPGAVQIAGRDTVEDKEKRLISFCTGETRILVSKASICGFGLNLQHCARMCFVGINNSFESWYQSVRRCWRFGQMRPVDVHIFYLHIEAPILRNLSRKETEAARMHHLMTQAILEHHQWQVPVQPYEPKGEMAVPVWLSANVERISYAERD